MRPTLSIITPVLNNRRFIESCIKNVAEQTGAHVQHVIVDGGSTDGTREIVEGYANRFPHIRWISEEDKGQSDAMNKGIRMATGDIIGFLNADDFYSPSALARAAEIFKNLPEPSLLVGNCNLLDDDGRIFEKNLPSKLKITDLLLGWEINQFPVNPSQYFYHKSLHDRIGMYNVDDHYAMDLDFLLRAVQTATVVYRNEFWGNYRFLKGTKTFEETRMGRSYPRCVKLLEQYREKLTIPQKTQVTIKLGMYHLNRVLKTRLNGIHL